MVTLVLATLLFSGKAIAGDKMLLNLENRIVEARQAGVLTPEEYDRFLNELGNVRLLEEEALADGVVTAEERRIVARAARSLERSVAAVRARPRPDVTAYGPPEPLAPVAAQASAD
jgi:hypothetical protein